LGIPVSELVELIGRRDQAMQTSDGEMTP
jgi:hypothetical protein